MSEFSGPNGFTTSKGWVKEKATNRMILLPPGGWVKEKASNRTGLLPLGGWVKEKVSNQTKLVPLRGWVKEKATNWMVLLPLEGGVKKIEKRYYCFKRVYWIKIVRINLLFTRKVGNCLKEVYPIFG